MSIELTESERRALIEAIKSRVAEDVCRETRATLNANQIAREIRNAVTKKLADEIFEGVGGGQISETEVFKKAIASDENRINAEIHRLLSAGITVSFNFLSKEPHE
ncbi:hypothetical protein [Pararhodospirillum photometricum]|uniref:hypothetical protein n=1 Tax=Pararhodospirillum photometricum TaxID=1084 RepID=UPI000312260C|nr:hypothetical protein [Pararhodospirillum photometricum]